MSGYLEKCWRCEKQAELVHDPLMPLNDGVSICDPCADIRAVVWRKYRDEGTNLKIRIPIDD